jgi:hypothetical protein
MEIFLNVLLHVMLIGSMVAFVGCSVLVTFRTDSSLERAIRASALFCGALIVLGAQAAGLSFADFTVNALSNSNLAGATAKVMGAVVPATAGIVIGRYLTLSVRKSENIAIRVLAFVGTLAATQFATIYAIGVKANGLEIGAPAIPNVAFVVGILLYVVLKYEPGKRAQTSKWAPKMHGKLGGNLHVRFGSKTSPPDSTADTMINHKPEH